MAKRKRNKMDARSEKKKRPAQDEDEFDNVEEADFTKEQSTATEEETAKAKVGAGKSGPGFFESLNQGFKTAGKTVERYARVGVSAVELEKLRVELKLANAKLGETLIKCWDDAPEIAIAATDPAVKDVYKKVKDLRRRIRETENKIRTLQQNKN